MQDIKQNNGVINLVFNCQGEFVKLIIDRQNKKVWLTSRGTNYQQQEMNWKMIWDKGKEEEQDRVADGLSDEEFKNVFIKQMIFYGYRHVG